MDLHQACNPNHKTHQTLENTQQSSHLELEKPICVSTTYCDSLGFLISLEVEKEYYQNCSVLGCVTQCSQSAAHSYEQFLQVQ